jgi:HEAT repeat protein
MEDVRAIIARFDGWGFRSREDRAHAIEELRALGMDPVAALLSDPDPRIRELAAAAAIMTDHDTGQAMILPLLRDADKNVRYYVCGLLYDFGDARAVPALIDRLRTDSVASVRVFAADAIGRIAGREPVPEIAVAALEEAAETDHEITPLGFTPSQSARDALSVIRSRPPGDA